MFGAVDGVVGVDKSIVWCAALICGLVIITIYVGYVGFALCWLLILLMISLFSDGCCLVDLSV